MKISNLFVYPLKSSQGINLKNVTITNTGFDLDRHYAVVNSENNIVTARENPKLLQIHVNLIANKLVLSYSTNHSIEITITYTEVTNTCIHIFDEKTFGKFVTKEADNWLTKVLDQPCRLIKIDPSHLRNTNNEDFKLSFTDLSPIHLISTSSVTDLNNKLSSKISAKRFRPNILVSGIEKPYSEENWKTITIGSCEFEVITPTKRCSLITINPDTLEKHKQQEPLRTLAKNKRTAKDVNFGIYLVPKNKGTIHITDPILVTQ